MPKQKMIGDDFNGYINKMQSMIINKGKGIRSKFFKMYQNIVTVSHFSIFFT